MYDHKTFIKELSGTDKNIQIINSKGVNKFTIDPFSIINYYISNNLLKISLDGEIITLNFRNTNEAKKAIEKFTKSIDILKENVPLFVNRKLKNFLLDEISYQPSEADNWDSIPDKLGEAIDELARRVKNIENNI